MTKTGTVKTILIIVILLLVGVLGVLGINTAKTYIGGASADTEPKSVLGAPGDDGKSATITWSSDKSTVGIVEYGTSPAALLLRAPESEASVAHTVVLSPLKPNINYYFRIRVGEEVYDNNGIPYSFKTKLVDIVIPTVVPTIVPVVINPTIVPITTSCVKGTDTMAYINCLRKKPNAASNTTPIVVTPVPVISGAKCSASVDFNKDGVINSLDRIKCLQSN